MAKEREERLQAMQMGDPNSDGVQAGVAVSRLFGGLLQQTGETMAARAALRQQGASKEQAKKAIPFGFNSVRQARANERVSQEASGIYQSNIRAGMDEVTARTLAMRDAARRLEATGGPGAIAQAAELRKNAFETYSAEQKRKAEMEKLDLEISGKKQDISDAELNYQQDLYDSDSWVWTDADGKSQMEEVKKSNIDRQQELMEQGAVKMAPSQATFDAEDVGLTRKAKGEIEEEIMTTEDTLAALYEVQAKFKPEYLTVWSKASFWGQGVLDRAGIDNLDPIEREAYMARAEFVQTSQKTLNTYIKNTTGAQMSEHEVPRLKGAIPNMDDGPLMFEAKLRSAIKFEEAKLARYQSYLRSGLTEQQADEILETGPSHPDFKELDDFGFKEPAAIAADLERQRRLLGQ
jgi:hypothetical protein